MWIGDIAMGRTENTPDCPCCKPTVTTLCCENPIARTLWITFVDCTGDMACLNGVSIAIPYNRYQDGEHYWRVDDVAVNGCGDGFETIELFCSDNTQGWGLNIAGCFFVMLMDAGDVTCDPFEITRTIDYEVSGNCGTGNVSYVITE